MAKLKNLSLNDSIIFEEGSDRGLFTQVTTAKGSSWISNNSLAILSILQDNISLKISDIGIKTFTINGNTLNTTTAGNLTNVDFTDSNFSNYITSGTVKQGLVSRRYRLTKYFNISNFKFGILYVLDDIIDLELSSDYANNIPKGIYIVQLNTSGQIITRGASEYSSLTNWNAVFDNPFLIATDAKVSLYEYSIKTKGKRGDYVNEYYIAHNNGIKELYMRVFFTGPFNYMVYTGGLNYFRTGSYTYSDSTFFNSNADGLHPIDMDVICGYSDVPRWFSGRSMPSATETNFIEFITGNSDTNFVTFWLHIIQR